jgi:hypothetical protein
VSFTIIKPERRLTVCPVPNEYRSATLNPCSVPPPLPAIRSQGRWLQQSGFAIAPLIRVRVMMGCLVITLD